MRVPRKDEALDALNDERDHLAIQISLAAHADEPDSLRLSALRQRLTSLELKIHNHRPADA